MMTKSRKRGPIYLPSRREIRTGPNSRFDLAIAEEICRRIALDESLLSICRDAHMPTPMTVYNWTRRHAEFRAAFIRARIDRNDAAARRIADACRMLWKD